MNLKELLEAVKTKSDALAAIMAEARDDRGGYDYSKVKSVSGGTDGVAAEVAKRLKEIEDLKGQIEKAELAERAAATAAEMQAKAGAVNRPPMPGGAKTDAPKPFSLGQAFADYKGIADLLKSGSFRLELPGLDYRNFKTLFQTGAGWAPESMRIDRIAFDEQRPAPIIANLIPNFPTTQAAVKYMEETTFTNAADARAEGGAYAESALVYTERTETVRSIGTSIPVTDEQLEDVAGMQAILENRLRFMVAQIVDARILEGSGVAPQPTGTLNVSGIQSQALGSDPVPDAIYKCMRLVRSDGFAEPNLVFINPTDWEPVRLLRTADGIYIFGSPLDPAPDRIWGTRVVQTTAVTVNTALLGDYAMHAGLYVRQGVEIEVGFVGDNFKEGKRTVRAGVRVAVVHFRPKAFGKVTGI